MSQVFHINVNINMNKPEQHAEVVSSSCIVVEEDSQESVDEKQLLKSTSELSLGAQEQYGLYCGPGYSASVTANNNFTSNMGAMSCCVHTESGVGVPMVYLFWASKPNYEINWSFSSNLALGNWSPAADINKGIPIMAKNTMLSSACVSFQGSLYLFFTVPPLAGYPQSESAILVSVLTNGSWTTPIFPYSAIEVQDASGNNAMSVFNSPLSAYVLEPVGAETGPHIVLYYRVYTTASTTPGSPSGLAYGQYGAISGSSTKGWTNLNTAVTLNPAIYPTFTPTTPAVAGSGRFAAVPYNDSKGMIVYQGTDSKLAHCTLERNGTVTAGATLTDLNFSYLTASTVIKKAPYSDSVHYFGNRTSPEGVSSRFLLDDSAGVVVTKPDTALDPIFCLPYNPANGSGPVSRTWACSCVFNGSVVVFYLYNNSDGRIYYSVGFSAP